MSNGNLLNPTDGTKIRILAESTAVGKAGDVVTVSPSVAAKLIAAEKAAQVE
jgi:hypothetical protein